MTTLLDLIPARGGPRECGPGRQEGHIYAECGFSPHGVPIEHFLIDLPIPVNPGQLGLSSQGVTFIERQGTWHVVDVIGESHYPCAADFVEECLLSEELIVTGEGVREIQALQEGDLVLTHRGHLRPVTHVMSKPYRGDVLTITTAFTNQPLRITPQHPVLVVRGTPMGNDPQFEEAQQVRAGDWLCFPRPLQSSDTGTVTLTYTKRYRHFKNSVRSAELEQRVRAWVGDEQGLAEPQRRLVLACRQEQTYSQLKVSDANTYAHEPGFARALSVLTGSRCLEKREVTYVATPEGLRRASVPKVTAADVAHEFKISRAVAEKLIRPTAREHRVEKVVPVGDHLLTLIGYYLAELST